MVKVKLLVSRSGADGAFSAGDVIEVSADEAKRMTAAGQCELVRAAAPEKATKRSKAEKAIK